MAKINNTTPDALSSTIGFIIKKGGLITVGTSQTASQGFFKLLHVGAGGDVVVRDLDGNYIPFRGILSGGWLPVLGDMVATSATIDGVLVTTTATEIDWYGGM
jgi:hypothetical protein